MAKWNALLTMPFRASWESDKCHEENITSVNNCPLQMETFTHKSNSQYNVTFVPNEATWMQSSGDFTVKEITIF